MIPVPAVLVGGPRDGELLAVRGDVSGGPPQWYRLIEAPTTVRMLPVGMTIGELDAASRLRQAVYELARDGVLGPSVDDDGRFRYRWVGWETVG